MPAEGTSTTTTESDIAKLRELIALWYTTRLWAEDLLRRFFCLQDARDILRPEHFGTRRIPGTRWSYRTHGIGVDVYRGVESGGIDFDFDKVHPDPWRLQVFAIRQLNDGGLANEEYWRVLMLDEQQFKTLAQQALQTTP